MLQTPVHSILSRFLKMPGQDIKAIVLICKGQKTPHIARSAVSFSSPSLPVFFLIVMIVFFSTTTAGLQAQETPEADLPGAQLDTDIPAVPPSSTKPAQGENPANGTEVEQPVEQGAPEENPSDDPFYIPEGKEEELQVPEPKEEAEKPQSNTSFNSREDDSVFYYTYLGPFFATGLHSIAYKGWTDGSHKEYDDGGFYTEPGAMLFIQIHPFITEVDLGFRLNFNDTKTTQVFHTTIRAKGKYMHPVMPRLLLGGGAGFYFESIPATETYDGTGILACLSGAYQLNPAWMLLLDLDFGFGNFGIGEGSTKLSYGITIGAGTKMGNL